MRGKGFTSRCGCVTPGVRYEYAGVARLCGGDVVLLRWQDRVCGGKNGTRGRVGGR